MKFLQSTQFPIFHFKFDGDEKTINADQKVRDAYNGALLDLNEPASFERRKIFRNFELETSFWLHNEVI